MSFKKIKSALENTKYLINYQIFQFIACIVLLICGVNIKASANDIKVYYIECNKADFDSIMQHYDQDIYINASLTYNSIKWDNLEMRVRGSGTRVFPKKSLKLKFRNEPFSNGRTTLNLNAEYEDPTYIRSSLSAKVFREIGVPCFETDYAKVYLNGSFHGLFVQIENMDDEFLKARNIIPIGNLYKATNDGACLALADVFKDVWEKKTNEDTDSLDFENFRIAINTIPDAEFENFVKTNMDYENMLNMIATNWLILNGSTYYHNYYMYHYSGANGKWAMFPWDLDKTYSKNSLFRPVDLSTDNWTSDNPFLERALRCPNIYKDLRKKVDYLRTSVINKEFMYPIIDSMMAIVKPTMLEDTSDNVLTEKQWLDAIDYDKYMIDKRYAVVCEQLDSCPTPFRALQTNKFVLSAPLLKWNTSVSRTVEAIKYKLYYSTDRYYAETKTTVVDNLVDTVYQIPTDFDKTKTYYWRVEAWSGKYFTESYDNFNYFQYKAGETLPCEINTEFKMTKAKSPYIVNCDLKVRDNGRLIAEPGVELVFEDNAHIYVTGALNFNGSAADPIIIRPNGDWSVWNNIKLENTKAACNYNYCNVTDVQLIAVNSNITYTNCSMEATKKLAGILVNTDHSTLTFRNNNLKGIESGEGMISFYCTGIIENNNYQRLRDQVQIIGCNNMKILNNIINDGGDDGIDMNKCTNILIKNNIISNIEDKGITVGDLVGIGSDSIFIENNLIYNCSGAGINAKNGSSAIIKNNTLYDNENNISLNQILVSPVNTHVKVINTIFYKPKSQDFIKDDKCSIDISYSISDKNQFEGIGNIKGNPGFEDIANFNFKLAPNSMCIDAGDPSSVKDPDGTIADIGAFYFEHKIDGIVINEINYKSGDSQASDDWVELYNNSDNDINLSNWTLKDDDDTHGFVIPANTVLKKRNYLVISQTIAKFKTAYPNVNNAIGDFGFGLGSTTDEVRLYNSNSVLIDSVKYFSTAPWAVDANGTGGSLQLISPEMDNTLPASWKAVVGITTPGATNQTSSVNGDDAAEKLFKIFPNPVKDALNLTLDQQFTESNIEYTIYDTDLKKILSANTQSNGDKLTINVAQLPVGTYIIKILIDNNQYALRFVKL